jgi:GTP-binding protein YchF
MQIGIVGLPFSGKSTLFQAITRTHIDPSLLARPDAHLAAIRIPDQRLDRLSAMFTPRNTVYATVEFVDVVGLKKGESGSTQFTTNFLSNVKTNDALVQVVRVFTNEAVPHPDGTIDPSRDIAAFETEFILSDLAILEGRLARMKKQANKSGDDAGKKEMLLLERCRTILDSGTSLREATFTRDEAQVLRSYQLLSVKPMLIALNLDESQRDAAGELVGRAGEGKGGAHTRVLSFFGKVEMELSELGEDDARAFMEAYGIAESALTALIRESYALLGLHSFFTVGEDECRAWTIRRGATAQEAAGAIHSDFITSFIRAEVVAYDDFIAQGGSFVRAKESGRWRLEGKEYIVRDGDIMTIRHS